MTADAGEPTPASTAAEARSAVVEDLGAQGLLRGSEPYTHTVPFSPPLAARASSRWSRCSGSAT